MQSNKRLFCFGYGYSARHLAAGLLGDGWTVAGTCRSEEKRLSMESAGMEAYRFDRNVPLEIAEAALRGSTHILISVPPDAEGDPVLDHHRGDVAALPGLEWVGYLSTTGVYGDRAGGWVDETSVREPTGPRGQRRCAAEDGWLALHQEKGVPVHLFRLAGIYGPGRNALETVRAGRARRIHKPGQVFSRIHVDDIVAVLRASMGSPKPGTAYNVCDDAPAPPDEVIAFACDLLDEDPLPLIPFEKAALSEMARSFYADNKKVSNRRIKEELGVVLRWPDYRQGLRALL